METCNALPGFYINWTPRNVEKLNLDFSDSDVTDIS